MFGRVTKGMDVVQNISNVKTHSIISRYHSIPSIIFSLDHTIIPSDPPNSHCLLSYFGLENAPDIPGSEKDAKTMLALGRHSRHGMSTKV